MSKKYTYKEYTSSNSLYQKYSAYQERYADNIRESDKVLIEMIKKSIKDGDMQTPSLLDIGCSTGNLLFNISRAVPGLQLTGGDLMEKVVDECKGNEKLTGINFKKMDILNLPTDEHFNLIVANAVSVYFEKDEYDRAIQSVSQALEPNGWYIGFEWIHSFPQELKITETSRSHPDGLTIFFRPMAFMEEVLRKNGFTDIEFQPFQIPIDLKKGETYGDNEDGFEDLNSYTVKTEDQQRLLFRGALYQPWCHFRARKEN